jgi:hypothetical protein
VNHGQPDHDRERSFILNCAPMALTRPTAEMDHRGRPSVCVRMSEWSEQKKYTRTNCRHQRTYDKQQTRAIVLNYGARLQGACSGPELNCKAPDGHLCQQLVQRLSVQPTMQRCSNSSSRFRFRTMNRVDETDPNTGV